MKSCHVFFGIVRLSHLGGYVILSVGNLIEEISILFHYPIMRPAFRNVLVAVQLSYVAVFRILFMNLEEDIWWQYYVCHGTQRFSVAQLSVFVFVTGVEVCCPLVTERHGLVIIISGSYSVAPRPILGSESGILTDIFRLLFSPSI
jgi:hypothetical protein